MKIKNLNFIEKHIEKIILAVGLIFFMVVLWFYILGTPYQVEVSGRGMTEKLTPDQVEERIQQQARQLESNISRPDLPFPPITLPSWTDDFRDRMTRGFLPVDRLNMQLGSAGLDRSLVNITRDPEQNRVVPTPPAPVAVKAAAGYGVLAAPANEEVATKLVQLVGELEQPRDFRYVSVGATFKLEDWRRRLRGENIAPNQRIPEEWWRARLFLTDVILERQELDPATGQWSEPIVVPSLPGQEPAYRNWQARLTTSEVPQLFEQIRDAQESIVRPPFVNMDRGTWTPPGSAQELTPAQAQELMEISNKLAQLRRTEGTADVDMGGGGNSQQIAELEARRDQLLGIVRPVAVQPQPEQAQQPVPGRRLPGRAPAPGLRPAPGTAQSTPVAPTTVPALPDVSLWAHDLTVKPGRTYRYRLVVSMLNPLYHINTVTREQRSEYFHRLSLQGEASEWSEPVKVDPEIYYFLTAQDSTRRLATVEVFRIFNGIWVRNNFEVRPGDAIGGPASLPFNGENYTVDLNTQAMVVDLFFPVPPSLGAAVDMGQTRMLVYDLASKQMTARTLSSDQQNETFQRLLREIQIRSLLANSSN